MKNRSTGSIITWEKKRYKIYWLFVLLMSCLNQSGTVIILITYKSPLQKRWVLKIGAVILNKPAPCGIWYKITFCNYFVWWLWKLLRLLKRMRLGIKK